MEEFTDKLGIEEYSREVYERLSKLVVSRKYINDNLDFFDLLMYRMWEEYYYSQSENKLISEDVKLLEIFLGTLIEKR